jgi:hypothetical protein
MNKIIVVGGGKGGVGKSTVSLALLDALLYAEYKPVYVETDDSNPDVYKAVNELVTSEICNLDDESGWIKLGGIIEAHPKTSIVVNTAARITDSLVEHGSILTDVAKELNMKLVMLWPLNRQRDGLELLKNFMDAEQDYAATYALLNTYFGKEDKFIRFRSSKLKDRVTDTIVFPELNDLVADKITDARLALWNADTGLGGIAERSALHKYRTAARTALEPVYE